MNRGRAKRFSNRLLELNHKIHEKEVMVEVGKPEGTKGASKKGKKEADEDQKLYLWEMLNGKASSQKLT